MMTTLTITLPHTPRCLSPNAKAPLTQRGAIVAGYKKTSAKRRARTRAGAVTQEALKGHKMQPTHYRVIWYFKGNKPDADNCLARCKAYLDGACKAMGIDDRTLDCAGIDRVHDLAKAGQVKIVFERRFPCKKSCANCEMNEGDYFCYTHGIISDLKNCCRDWTPTKEEENDA